MGNEFKKQYIKEKKLGGGNQGEVFMCTRKADNQPVAVKIFSKKGLQDQDFKRMIREKEVLRQSTHRNIIQYIDFLQDNDNCYIIMELAEGGNLSKFIETRKDKPYEDQEILDIFCQLLLAVNHINQHKFVHRDINPNNIFFNKYGVLKLGDLGCVKQSKKIYRNGKVEQNSQQLLQEPFLPQQLNLSMRSIYDGSRQSSITQSTQSSTFLAKSLELDQVQDQNDSLYDRQAELKSSVLSQDSAQSTFSRSSIYGTAEYQAPEFQKFENFDYRCDIWPLGIILYELCQNTKPSTEQINNNSLPFSRCQVLKNLLEICLKEDPKERLNASQILEIPEVQQTIEGLEDRQLNQFFNSLEQNLLNKKWEDKKNFQQIVNLNSVYNGQIKKNKNQQLIAHGEGCLNLNDQTIQLFGEWRNNKLHGFGIQMLKDGQKCKGNFQDGKPFNAKGVFVHSDGMIEEGIFKNSKLSGLGNRTYPSGKSEKGFFIQGQLNGEGVKTFSTGLRWEGQFKDGEPQDGQGVLTLPTGEQWVGEFINGKAKNGKGVLVQKSGEREEGTFIDGKLQGEGQITYQSGQVSLKFGEFESGLLNGKGTITFKTGEIWEGFFKNDQFMGLGQKVFGNGTKKEGNFMNGLLNGQGKINYKSGIIHSGQFVNGLLEGNGEMTLKSGIKLLGEFKAGVIKDGLGFIITKTSEKYKGRFKNGKPYKFNIQRRELLRIRMQMNNAFDDEPDSVLDNYSNYQDNFSSVGSFQSFSNETERLHRISFENERDCDEIVKQFMNGLEDFIDDSIEEMKENQFD